MSEQRGEEEGAAGNLGERRGKSEEAKKGKASDSDAQPRWFGGRVGWVWAGDWEGTKSHMHIRPQSPVEVFEEHSITRKRKGKKT